MAVLQATSITGGLTMHGMAAGFVKLNASGAVIMDTNTYATESSLSSYLPLSGGTINGNLTMSGAGNSTSIIFGESTKRINVEGYWMMFKGHENEGFRWQTAGQDNVTYTTRMQLTSSALTVNGNTVWHAGNLTNLNQLSNGPGYITQTNALQPIYNNSGAFNLNTSGQHAWVRYSEGAWVNSPVSGNYSHVLSFNLAPDNRTVQVYFGDVPGYLWWRPFQGNSVIHPWERILTSNNYNSWAPTLTGGGASGTWGIDVTGNSATTSQRSFSGDISTGGMGRFTGWYNGTAATGLASEVGISSGEGYVIVYNRNSGSYGSLNLNAVNIKIDPQGGSATVSGSQIVTNNGGTWSINVTGSAGSASVASSITGGIPSGSDHYINLRVIRNANASPNDGMYIGYGNGGSGNTRLYGGGSTGNHAYVDVNGDIWRSSGGHQYVYNTGTWGINISGNAGSASSASSVPWTGVSAGIRSNYDLQFRPPDNVGSYGGIAFATAGNSFDAGYFLVRGGPDSDVYTQNGITLVADTGWLTLAQRTRSDRGVRIMTGATSTSRLQIDSSGNTDIGLGAGTVTLYHGGSARFWTGSDGTRTQGWSYFQNTSQGLHWPGNNWHLMPADSADFRVHSGNSAASSLRMETNGTTRGYFYAENTNEIGILTNGRSWALRMNSSRNAFIHGQTLTINADNAAWSSIYMNDGDEGMRELHCNSNRIGFLTQAGNWGAWLYDGADWEAASSVRAPIFYDSDNTAYYANFADSGTSVNIAGKITTAVSNGTIISHGAMTDAVGYNGSYGTYIGSVVGGTYYIYANGTFYDNGPFRTLIHSGNIGSYTVLGLNCQFLGSGSSNVSWGYSAVLRNENGSGGNPTYAPILHLAASDTMWQIAGAHGGSTTLVWRSGYAGTWSTPWWNILHSGNYTSYSPSLTGSGASGTWGINISGVASQVSINYNNDSNSTYQLLWGSGNSVYGTGDVWVNPNSDVINARGGFISNGNPWGTSNSAFFPNGITTAGGTNWIYGFTYIGNAPGNGAGHEFYTSGSSYSTGDVEAAGSMRAPIFYDRNDTSYYLDPNSSSRIRNLYVGDSGSNWSDPGGWGTVLWVSNAPHAILRIENRNDARQAIVYSHQGQMPAAGSGGDYDFRLVRNFSDRITLGSSYVTMHASVNMSYNSLDYVNQIYQETGGQGNYMYANNSGSYGSLRLTSTRNGWYGIYFDSGSTLMMNSNETGFYRQGYGWQWRWENGTAYVNKNSYGGGTSATVWDSVNAARAANSNLMYYQSFTLDANTMDSNSTGFTYSVNAPFTGPIARFSTGGGYDLWLGGSYGGGGNVFYVRTRNGDAGSMNPWRLLITDGNIASQSVSYASSAGNADTVDGWHRDDIRAWGNLTGVPSNIFYHSQWVGSTYLGTNGDLYLSWYGWLSNAINQDVRNSASPSFAQVYTGGWFRNYGNQGIYNQDYGVHFYAQGSTAWSITGSGGNIELQFRSNHNSTVRGYVYANTSNEIGFLRNDGNWALRCDPSSNVFGHNNLYAYYDVIAYYSDERLKTKTGKIDNALTKIMSLEGFSYVHNDLAVSVGYTDNKKQQIGLSAQEVQKIAPELVTLAAFDVAFDENGNEYSKSGENYLTIKYDRLVPILVEAIKEQQKQIEELKAKLN